MATKPGFLCSLKKGKFIGGQNGFVDTFNWLVSCISSLKGTRGIKIIGLNSGSPTITIDKDKFKELLKEFLEEVCESATVVTGVSYSGGVFTAKTATVKIFGSPSNESSSIVFGTIAHSSL